MEEIMKEMNKRSIGEYNKYIREINIRANWYLENENLRLKRTAKICLEAFAKTKDEQYFEYYKTHIESVNDKIKYYKTIATNEIANKYWNGNYYDFYGILNTCK